MLHDLIIYQKIYDFLFWLKPTVQRFAKAHKYSLGIQLEDEVIALLKLIIRANFARDDKKERIDECFVIHETIIVLIRLSKDYKLISIKQYEFASEQLIEIGRLLGGWRRKFS